MTTWREMITEHMAKHGDSLADVVSMCAETNNWKDENRKPYKDDSWLDLDFDAGYGGEEGARFTIWTTDRIYFPACYDGSEWCTSVARNPNGKPTGHVGG